MSFDTALALTLLLVVFVLACTMANLLARITRLERFARQIAGLAIPAGTLTTGTPVPEDLTPVIKDRDPARLLFLSGNCPACDEAIGQVQQWPEQARRATLLLYREEPAADFVAPPAVRVVPRAAGIFESLAVTSTPTFVHVERGLVVGRSTGFMVTATNGESTQETASP